MKMKVIYTCSKWGSQFFMKDINQKRHIHDIIYHILSSEGNFIQEYFGKCARTHKERTKDHNGRDQNSHILPHSIKSGHNQISESKFQVIGKNILSPLQKKKMF